MIDRFENIADLHEEILTFLLDYKERNQSDLTFLLNNPDNPKDREALEKGWWFKESDLENINIVFYRQKDKHLLLSINIFKGMHISFETNKEYQQKHFISDVFLKNHHLHDVEIDNNKTIKYSYKDYYKNLFLIAIKTIEELLESDFLLYERKNLIVSQNIFQKNLQSIQQLRNENKIEKFYLSKISVNNYHSVQNTAIQEIPNDTKWLFLTGENGAGKTLILQSIAIGLYGKNEPLILPQKKETRIEVNYQSINTVRNINYHNSTEYLDFFRPLENLACYGPFRLDVLNEGSENRDSPRSAPTYGLFGNYDVLFKNIETELKFSYYENKTKFEHLTKMLKQIIPTLHKIEFDAKNRKVYYYEKNEQDETEIYEKISFSELATGVKSIIAMVGDIYLRFSGLMQKGVKTDEYLAPEALYGIVIIDELDLHLHPKWQKSLPSLLSNVFPNIQFIASTHSAIPILGAPENSVLLRVNRNKEEGITVERLEHLEKQLKDLTPNLILTSEIFGLQDIFPITHDKSQRIRTEDTMNELQENDEMMEALKSYMNTDKEEELLKLFSK